jgi:hypothetical protein
VKESLETFDPETADGFEPEDEKESPAAAPADVTIQ